MFETVDEEIERTEEQNSVLRFAVVVLSVAAFAGILLLAVVLE